ncbi:MAG: hypothetical protein ACSHXF_16385 [Aquaticitalea sp.]
MKNLDDTSTRGKRLVAIGLAEPEGKTLLKGFNFNLRSPFASVFKSQYALDPATGVVSIEDFNPTVHLGLPEGATHASFSVAMSMVDLAQDSYVTKQGVRTNFAIVNGTIDLTLSPSAVPVGTGFTFYFFLIEFFQEINGVQYPLKNNAYNALYLMEVL